VAGRFRFQIQAFVDRATEANTPTVRKSVTLLASGMCPRLAAHPRLFSTRSPGNRHGSDHTNCVHWVEVGGVRLRRELGEAQALFKLRVCVVGLIRP
jgi:hypothetical protein